MFTAVTHAYTLEVLQYILRDKYPLHWSISDIYVLFFYLQAQAQYFKIKEATIRDSLFRQQREINETNDAFICTQVLQKSLL